MKAIGLKVRKGYKIGRCGHFTKPESDLKIKTTDLKFSTKITCGSYTYHSLGVVRFAILSYNKIYEECQKTPRVGWLWASYTGRNVNLNP